MPMRTCMKYFTRHAYVLKCLHEVKCYVCTIYEMQRYVLWNMMPCYAHNNACQEWNYACLTEMRKYELSMSKCISIAYE